MFEVIARLTIRDGQLDEFTKLLGEALREAREKDTKTLRFDYFLSSDGRHCEVHEAYVDADAFIEHQQHTAEPRARLLHDCVVEHKVAFYGEPSPALTNLMQRMPGMSAIDQYRFFQGLESPVEIPA